MPSAHDRHNAFDAMLSRLGRFRDSSARDCPDAETLAAYCERSLARRERRICEAHFSNCARCQAQLAALARIESASGAPAAAGAKSRGWLERLRAPAPAMAAAAVLAAFIAIVVIENLPQRPAGMNQAASRREAETQPQQMAQAERNVSPARSAPSGEAVPSASAPEAAARHSPPAPAARLESPSAAGAGGTSGERGAASGQRRGEAAQEQFGGREIARPSASELAQGAAGAPPSMPAVSAEAAGIYGMHPGPSTPEVPAFQAGENSPAQSAASGAETSPSVAVPRSGAKARAPAGAGGEERAGGESAGAAAIVGSPAGARPAREAAQTLPSAPAKPVVAGTRVLESSEGATFWKIGPNGAIYRRRAGGAWEKQHSGVSADLLAGSAPSAGVCWVVGRRGTIVRTLDGEHWTKLNSPSGQDLVAVSATGPHSAMVLTADGQRFSTSDDGLSWRSG